MPERLAQRVLVVGWDAADWKIIDALLAAGRMPALRSLIERGIRGDLISLDPKLSPLLWTSIATGKTADKHGILNFIEPDASGAALRPASSTTRRTKALWNILTQQGMRTNVVGWYASHPAEPIRGVAVSNLFQEAAPANPDDPWPLTPGSVHPASAADDLAALRMHALDITAQEIASIIPQLDRVSQSDPRPGLLAKLIAQCASINNIATTLLGPDAPHDAKGWDCTMIFHEAIDVVGHHFMQYYPPKMPHVNPKDFDLYRHVMHGVYQVQDMMLDAMLKLAGPDTTVILLSDHGFHSDHLRPPVPPAIDDEHAAMDANWHRQLGVLVMAGPGIKKAAAEEQVHGATLLDICPTILTLLGVPIGADMDGRVLIEALDRPVNIDRVFSWDDLPGDAGQHPADLRVDPFDAQQTMKQLAELGYVQAVPGGVQAQMEQLRIESKFNLGVVHMSARRYDQSLVLFKELAEERPDDPRFAMNLAHSYQQLGHWADAGRTLEDLLRRHPNLPDAKLHFAAARLSEGKLEEARAILESAKAEMPDHPERLIFMGHIDVLLKRFPEAAAAFKRVIDADPHDARAHNGLAMIELHNQNFEGAVEHALRAVELKHFFPEAYYTIGQALTWMQDFPRAIQAFSVCISMQPGHVDAHRFLMSIYRHLGDRENAPKHRRIVEDLLARRDKNLPFQQAYLADAPAGPLDWARTAGLSDDPADRA